MATYYIATTGNDTTGNGSSGNPWATLSKAYSSSTGGDTIECAAGTYTFATASMSTARTLRAASNVAVIFDGASADRYWGLGGNWTFTGITFQNISQTNSSNYPIFGYLNTSGSGTATFTNCIFKSLIVRSDNAAYGGVMGTFANSGAFVLTSCLMFNITPVSGYAFGKLFARDNLTVTLTGCVIAFVSLSENFRLIGDSTVTLTIKNTIIYNGTAKILTGATATATYSDFYSITSAPTGTGVITSDPLFIDAAAGNFRLRPTSPCLNTGSAV